MSKTPHSVRSSETYILQCIDGKVKIAMNGHYKSQGSTSKTGSFGQTLDGLRVAVSVNWGEYPAHMTRQIIVTVGKLRVYEAQWCDTSRLAAVAMLEKILAGCDDSILADFRRFLGEVVL